MRFPPAPTDLDLLQDSVQKITDKYIKEVENTVSTKEKDIMKV